MLTSVCARFHFRPPVLSCPVTAERIPLGAVAASSSSSAFWLLVGACIFASLLFVVGLGVKLAWAVRDARHRDQMEAVRTELQRRAYLGVFFSPDGKSLPGILAEMGTLQDGDVRGHVCVCVCVRCGCYLCMCITHTVLPCRTLRCAFWPRLHSLDSKQCVVGA